MSTTTDESIIPNNIKITIVANKFHAKKNSQRQQDQRNDQRNDLRNCQRNDQIPFFLTKTPHAMQKKLSDFYQGHRNLA